VNPIEPNPHLTLILGGARSGKSLHGETLLGRHPPPWIYIATAQAFDGEMRARIAMHRARRAAGWRTVEAPLALVPALAEAGDAPVLVDCLTLWLTNLLLAEADLEAEAEALVLALGRRAAPAIMVASEVGLGIVPETALARRFRDAAGILHQKIAARAGRVLLMVAGLPLIVK
jgi:adenosyl cobinamide kinase/adenosyl cobinamide phosphate guanylyltransferase